MPASRPEAGNRTAAWRGQVALRQGLTLTEKSRERPKGHPVSDKNPRCSMEVLVAFRVLLLGIFIALLANANAAAVGTSAAGEYAKHFEALSKLSVAVAEAMPAEKYGFRPHPESMGFAALMVHIATTNYQFCAGLKDAKAPALPSAADKEGVVKLLSNSFKYCSGVIASLTEQQLNAPHNSPDGRLPGREVLLAMYVHVAHHRGQAEIYLRDNGIKPPPYRI
jgi:uncharacterized damage-inducible protein DinB